MMNKRAIQCMAVQYGVNMIQLLVYPEMKSICTDSIYSRVLGAIQGLNTVLMYKTRSLNG